MNLNRLGIVALVFLFSCSLAWATPQVREVSPITGKLHEMIKDGSQEISLGAMLVSVDVNDYWFLEPVVRSSISTKDPLWVTAIKWYTLSCYTIEDEDAIEFINSIPVDKENFTKLIEFESSVTRHPGSKILDKLLFHARNAKKEQLQILAIDKLDRVWPISDGWVADYIRPYY